MLLALDTDQLGTVGVAVPERTVLFESHTRLCFALNLDPQPLLGQSLSLLYYRPGLKAILWIK